MSSCAPGFYLDTFDRLVQVCDHGIHYWRLEPSPLEVGTTSVEGVDLTPLVPLRDREALVQAVRANLDAAAATLALLKGHP